MKLSIRYALQDQYLFEIFAKLFRIIRNFYHMTFLALLSIFFFYGKHLGNNFCLHPIRSLGGFVLSALLRPKWNLNLFCISYVQLAYVRGVFINGVVFEENLHNL